MNWLAQQTRPDLSYKVSVLSKSFKQGDTKDMKKLIKIMKLVEKDIKTINIEKLMGKVWVETYTDASFNSGKDGNSQVGYLVCLRDEYGHKCPIAWKSRVSRRVVKSTIEAEALGMGDGMEMAIYINELWMELTGEGKMNVVVKTDSKTLERAIKSTEDRHCCIETND